MRKAPKIALWPPRHEYIHVCAHKEDNKLRLKESKTRQHRRLG